MPARMALLAILMLTVVVDAHAQDASDPEQASSTPDDADASDADAPPRPKVAVVLVGDPDERMRGLANRVERALGDRVDRPQDPAIRRALMGDLGSEDDGLDALRNERRRLGLDEARDAAVLRRIGQPTGTVALALVRHGDDGAELVVFDVRRGSFFEGHVPLTEATTPGRIARFVVRRARVAAQPVLAPVLPALPPIVRITLDPDASPVPTQDEEQGPDLFEIIWPYLVAGALAAAGIVAIVVGTTGGSTSQPVLRFQPGGR